MPPRRADHADTCRHAALPSGRPLVEQRSRIERAARVDGARSLQNQRLAAARDQLEVGRSRRGAGPQPAQIERSELEGRTELPHPGERPRVITRQTVLLQGRKVGFEALAKTHDRAARAAPCEVGVEHRSRARTQFGVGVTAGAVDVDDLGVRRQLRRGCIEREDLSEVGALQLEIAGVVKVAQPPRRRIDLVQHDRGLAVRVAVIGTSRVGQPVSVDLEAEQTARAEVLARVLDHRPPDGQLLHVDAVGRARGVGPSRLHVEWARRWAEAGIAVLRLDLPGLGDSAVQPGETDGEVYAIETGRAVGAAVAMLRARFGAVDCQLTGICSGAHHAYRAALAGADVQ